MKESGSSRFDIQLKLLVKGIPGFIFELKATKDIAEDLNLLADKAIAQINEKKYETELITEGIKPIIKIGIAFRGKNAVVKNA